MPLVPAGKRLPWRYRLHILQGSLESEVRYLHRLRMDGPVALDIGANEGMYSYRLSQLVPRVHAFEPNEDLTTDLRAWNRDRVQIHHTALSSDAGTATLYVPLLSGRPLVGWGSLVNEDIPGTGDRIEKTVRMKALDSYELNGVSFVKIDVEGYELELLKGAARTIERNRPVVMIEVRERNLTEVRAWFERFSYVHLRPIDLLGVDGTPENHFFVPSERAGRKNV